MFMPLMGLLVTATLFSTIAVTVLALVPRFRVCLWSVVVFVLSEYAGAAGFSMIYTPLVARPSGELTSRVAVFGYFAGVFISAIATVFSLSGLRRIFIVRYAQRASLPKA
jgi:hypothetical protein